MKIRREYVILSILPILTIFVVVYTFNTYSFSAGLEISDAVTGTSIARLTVEALTPTVTNTPTITQTPSNTPTPTSTYTPTATYTPSLTPTLTPTPSFTPSITPVPTETFTPSPSPVPSCPSTMRNGAAGYIMPTTASHVVVDIPQQASVLIVGQLTGKSWVQLQYQTYTVWVNRNFVEFGDSQGCQSIINASLLQSLDMANRLPAVFGETTLVREDAFVQFDANRPWLYGDQRRANIGNGVLQFERVFEVRTLSQSSIIQAQLYNTFVAFAYDSPSAAFMDNNSFVGIQFRVDAAGTSYYEMRFYDPCTIAAINLVTPAGTFPQTTSESTAQGCVAQEQTYVEVAIVDNILRVFINEGELSSVNLPTEQLLQGGIRFTYSGMESAGLGFHFVVVAGNTID